MVLIADYRKVWIPKITESFGINKYISCIFSLYKKEFTSIADFMTHLNS